jgi:hypothetical protein
MAWAPDYCTAAELKSHLRITDTADDTLLGVAITAASRAIDLACNRQFGLSDPAVARYYTYGGASVPSGGSFPISFSGPRAMLEVDDLMTVTSLVVKVDEDGDGTFEETLTIDTDFRMFPYNAAADGVPWSHIVLEDGVSFPTQLRGVEVTAKWGWSSVPVLVKQACLVQAARFFQRRNAPFGIAGSPEMGSEMRLLAMVDPDVALMLSSVVRHWVAV